MAQMQEDPHFQIGSKFERSFHTNLEDIPQAFQKAALSVAQFGSSTAFYVGRHEGKDIMATAAHSALSRAKNYTHDLTYYQENSKVLCRIFVNSEDSPLRDFQFNLLDTVFECKSLVAIYPELDLAFFELVPKDTFDLSPYGIEFSSTESFSKGSPLYSLSYSGFKNTGYISFDLGFTKGPLCSSFVGSNEIDYLESYDDLTQESLYVPSFPIGCDASPGDSGAPLLNQNGSLVGMLWSVSNSKNQYVPNEDHLKGLLQKTVPYSSKELNFVWLNLNYSLSLEKSIQSIKKETESCNTVACKVLKSLISTK